MFFNSSTKRPSVLNELSHADDASGLTWGGQTYETETGKVGGKLSLEFKLVGDGVDIAETEVVLLHFSPGQ
jgi:hypothetical protein